MKKIGTILLVIFILSFLIVSICSADYGFSSLSDENLLNAQEELNNALLDRGLLKRLRLPAGVYIVGEDLPEGKYVLSPANYPEKYYPRVTVFRNKSDYSSYTAGSYNDISVTDEILPDDGSCMVTLEKGYVLVLSNVNYYMEKYNFSSF